LKHEHTDRGFQIRTTRAIGMAAIIVLASASLGWAQPAGSDPSFERMRAEAQVGDRLTVDLVNGSSVEGRVIDGSPDGLVISTASATAACRGPTSALSAPWPRRHPGSDHRHGSRLACGAALGSLFANEGHDAGRSFFGLTLVGSGRRRHRRLANIPKTCIGRARRRARRSAGGWPAPHRRPRGTSRSDQVEGFHFCTSLPRSLDALSCSFRL
jgi:hypothetical protein